ncbi:hypothetical protein AB0H45_17860 [Streptomyces atroolivaceus]|uniref:hypothetical protein n=1 Tax=Streptomyces atroolivaceus TaxID=66869 RepID=UPI0033CB8029
MNLRIQVASRWPFRGRRAGRPAPIICPSLCTRPKSGRSGPQQAIRQQLLELPAPVDADAGHWPAHGHAGHRLRAHRARQLGPSPGRARYVEDNQEARTVHGDDDQPGGVGAHALAPEAANRRWESITAALRGA